MKPKAKREKLLTLREAGEAWGVTKERARQLMEEFSLTQVRFGKNRRYVRLYASEVESVRVARTIPEFVEAQTAA